MVKIVAEESMRLALLYVFILFVEAQTYTAKIGILYTTASSYRTYCNSVSLCQTMCNSELLCGGFIYRSDWGTKQGYLLYRISTANSINVGYDTYLRNGYAMTFDITIRPGLIIDVDIVTASSPSTYPVKPGDTYIVYNLPMTGISYSSGGNMLVTMTSASFHFDPVRATNYNGFGQTYLIGTYTIASCVTACFRNTTCNFVYFIKSNLRCGLLPSIDSSKLANSTTPTFSDFTIAQKTWSYDSRYVVHPNYQMAGIQFLNTNVSSIQSCQMLCSGCPAFQFFYTNSTCILFKQVASYTWVAQDVSLFILNATIPITSSILETSSKLSSAVILWNSERTSANSKVDSTTLILQSTSERPSIVTHVESVPTYQTTEVTVTEENELPLFEATTNLVTFSGISNFYLESIASVVAYTTTLAVASDIQNIEAPFVGSVIFILSIIGIFFIVCVVVVVVGRFIKPPNSKSRFARKNSFGTLNTVNSRAN